MGYSGPTIDPGNTLRFAASLAKPGGWARGLRLHL